MSQKPDLLLFDEPESGVDLENIVLIGNVINELLERDHTPTKDKSVKEIKKARSRMGLVITHTGFILDYVTADQGQVLYDGVLACKSNPVEIFKQIKSVGYEECVRCGSET
jgi:Fe-S cluster assembly ATP-binding protein